MGQHRRLVPVLTGRMMLSGERRLCAGVDIVAWSRRTRAPEREALQRLLHLLLRATAIDSGTDFRQWRLQAAGDGAFIVLPAGIDEARTIAAFCRVLGAGLRHHNTTAPETARTRARLSLGQGMLREQPLGYSTNVAIEVPRMLDSAALRGAVDAYPAAGLAVIVSDDLYRDVVSHDLHGTSSSAFWPVEVRVKNFRAPAWVSVDDRTGGPADPARTLGVPPRREPVAPPLPLFVPGWTSRPGAPPDRALRPGTVDAVLGDWRRGVAGPVLPAEIRMGFEEMRGTLQAAAELLAAGHPEAALRRLAPALEQAPHSGPLVVGAARILLYGGSGHAPRVRELLDWALVHAAPTLEGTVEPLLMRAESAYDSGDARTAEHDLRQVLAALPGPATEPGPLALLRLGDCQERLGHTAEAEKTWTELLVLRPLNPDVLLRLGHLALTAREPHRADRLFGKGTEALHQAPGTAMAADPAGLRHGLAMGRYSAALAFGDRDAAARHLTEAAEAAPDDPFTAAEQAFDAHDRGDPARARPALLNALTTAVRAPRGDIVLDRLRDRGLITEETWTRARAAHSEAHGEADSGAGGEG
ncbi:hypothetical protein ABT112_16230 [Streptomyces sp. NPDC002055]|uniref:tetratricopeptide repeat protein n=1 Tax=Streptomyces sp. NPDC002055 TaxID=3154534 RepID=UPI003321D1B1